MTGQGPLASGVLPTAWVQRFETHLTVCEGCDVYVAQMRQTIGLLGRLTPDDLAPQGRAQLLAAFRGWKTQPPP